jgi:inner membrane protein
MPSSIGHAFAAVAIGAPLAPPRASRRFWIAGILTSVLLDIDAVGRPFGLGDLAFLGGHRALTHSLPFALALGLAVAWLGFRSQSWNGARTRIATYLTLAAVSHGLLDTLASYGSGVALFYPFSPVEYSAPWQPLRAVNEIWWIWLPATALILLTARLRRRGPR